MITVIKIKAVIQEKKRKVIKDNICLFLSLAKTYHPMFFWNEK